MFACCSSIFYNFKIIILRFILASENYINCIFIKVEHSSFISNYFRTCYLSFNGITIFLVCNFYLRLLFLRLTLVRLRRVEIFVALRDLIIILLLSVFLQYIEIIKLLLKLYLLALITYRFRFFLI